MQPRICSTGFFLCLNYSSVFKQLQQFKHNCEQLRTTESN
nr:MAG TPA: hypothetical protein [Caudoviricetes sp.]